MKKKLIFGTCLSRSGGSLASNILLELVYIDLNIY